MSVLEKIQRYSAIGVNFPELLLRHFPFGLGVVVPGAVRIFVLDLQGTPTVRSPRRSLYAVRPDPATVYVCEEFTTAGDEDLLLAACDRAWNRELLRSRTNTDYFAIQQRD
jgi:hypothetical protein